MRVPDESASNVTVSSLTVPNENVPNESVPKVYLEPCRERFSVRANTRDATPVIGGFAKEQLAAMFRLQAERYGTVIAKLLATPQNAELGAGTLDARLAKVLAGKSAGELFPHATIVDDQMADACLAGLWLLANGLEQSHQISQSIETPTGSFWHGIMHRREGDFGNSKYWFRRVGRHPIFERLGSDVRELAAAVTLPEAAPLASQAEWSPERWIDLCEVAVRSGRGGPSADSHSCSASATALVEFCRQVQALEWGHLFDYSYRHAVGA